MLVVKCVSVGNDFGVSPIPIGSHADAVRHGSGKGSRRIGPLMSMYIRICTSSPLKIPCSILKSSLQSCQRFFSVRCAHFRRISFTKTTNGRLHPTTNHGAGLPNRLQESAHAPRQIVVQLVHVRPSARFRVRVIPSPDLPIAQDRRTSSATPIADGRYSCAVALPTETAPWYQTNAPGLIRSIGSCFFPVGLIMIVLSGADLFTSNVMVISLTPWNRRIPS